MVKISGYSDDIIEVTTKENGEWVDQEFDSFDYDTLIELNDGTRIRMSYRHGTWRALIEATGTAQIAIEPLFRNDDWYSDLVTVETENIKSVWKEKKQ